MGAKEQNTTGHDNHGSNGMEYVSRNMTNSWWHHQMETFSALLAICAGNSPVSGEFPTQRPMTRSFDVFFDLRLNKRLSRQSWGWWLETLSHPLWRHRNVTRLWLTSDSEEHGVLWYYQGVRNVRLPVGLILTLYNYMSLFIYLWNLLKHIEVCWCI